MTKKHKPLPVILDRLQHALAARHRPATRSEALGIAASAFGHRNANELAAAAEAGLLDLPEAAWHPAGTLDLGDGQSLAIAVDPLSGAPFGIDASFLEQASLEHRRDSAVPTPYGHLVGVSRLLDETAPDPRPRDVDRTASAIAAASASRPSLDPAKASRTEMALAELGLDDSALATIRAALRLYSDTGNGDPGNRSDEIHEIATCDGNEISLDDEGIEDLYQRLRSMQGDRETHRHRGGSHQGAGVPGTSNHAIVHATELASGQLAADISLPGWEDAGDPKGRLRLVRNSYGLTIEAFVPRSGASCSFHLEFKDNGVLLAFNGAESDDPIAVARFDGRRLLVEAGMRQAQFGEPGEGPDWGGGWTGGALSDTPAQASRLGPAQATRQPSRGVPSSRLAEAAARLLEGSTGNGSRVTVSKADHDALVDAVAGQDKPGAGRAQPSPETFLCPAEAHSDDRVAIVRFDAAKWLASAHPRDIKGLRDCAWGGDYPADEVARWEEECHPGGELTAMFSHAVRMTDAGHDCGFECHVQPAPALAFLKETRRDVYDLIMMPASCLLTEEENGDWVLTPEDDGILPGSGIPGAGIVVGHKVSADTAMRASMRLLPKGTAIQAQVRLADGGPADASQIVGPDGLNVHGGPNDPFGLASFEVLTGAAVRSAEAWAAENPGYAVVPVKPGDIEDPCYVSDVGLARSSEG